MAHAYHRDRKKYFEHQRQVTSEHIIPFIEESTPVPQGIRILEVGCGEAGVIKAFLDRGACAVGVDLNATRLARGKEYLAESISEGRTVLLNQDVHSLGSRPELLGSFDLIVLKDVIEHVANRQMLFDLMARLLRPRGRVFLSFPPWNMPFGGHQQISRSWLLARTPYVHLLPDVAYRAVLSWMGEEPSRIKSLLATKQTGIGTSEFERLLGDAGYRVVQSRHYLLNPMYTYRFGVRPMVQARWVTSNLSWRDFVTTCAYYLVEPGVRGAEVQATQR